MHQSVRQPASIEYSVKYKIIETFWKGFFNSLGEKNCEVKVGKEMAAMMLMLISSNNGCVHY